MTERNDGGPAFPSSGDLEKWGDWDRGMTLRDWFAGQALAGMCANTDGLENASKRLGQGITAEFISMAAYELADGMIKARGEGS